MGEPDPPITAANAAPDRLDSWKEIAAFFGRGVTTVQCWEEATDRRAPRLLPDVVARRSLDRVPARAWVQRVGRARGVVEWGHVAVLGALPLGLTSAVSCALPTGSFYLRVRSVAGAAVSDASNEILAHVNVPVPPTLPSGLLGLVVGNTVSLAWRNSLSGGTATSLILDVNGTLSGSLPLGVADTFTVPAVTLNSPVDVSAMPDFDDDDRSRRVVDRVQHAVVALTNPILLVTRQPLGA